MKPLALAFAAATFMANPALASDLTNLSEDDRSAFRGEVRAYLLEHPEVLMEAIAVLERRQAAEAVALDAAMIAANAEELFSDGYSHVAGNPEGDITMVEFVDYRCGYCRKAFPELMELIREDGNIRLIYKEFPIMGEGSTMTAKFAISTQLIAGQEGYAQVHDALMTMRAKPSEAARCRGHPQQPPAGPAHEAFGHPGLRGRRSDAARLCAAGRHDADRRRAARRQGALSGAGAVGGADRALSGRAVGGVGSRTGGAVRSGPDRAGPVGRAPPPV